MEGGRSSTESLKCHSFGWISKEQLVECTFIDLCTSFYCSLLPYSNNSAIYTITFRFVVRKCYRSIITAYTSRQVKPRIKRFPLAQFADFWAFDDERVQVQIPVWPTGFNPSAAVNGCVLNYILHLNLQTFDILQSSKYSSF